MAVLALAALLRKIMDDSTSLDAAVETLTRDGGRILGASEVQLLLGKTRPRTAQPNVLAVPVFFSGTVAGELFAQKPAGASFSDEDRATAELLAGIAGQLLCRINHEDRERLIVADRLATIARFAEGVAHELNNPLSYVVSNLSFLRDELQGGSAENVRELRDVVREMTDGVARVTRIVRDLQAVTRSQQERPHPVSLEGVLGAAVQKTRKEAKGRAKVESELRPLPTIHGNEAALMEAFRKLLDNALEALPEGDPSAHTIAVRARTDKDGWALVEISDTGVGIAAEHRPLIFDPFFSTRIRGPGLGLTVAHGIITAHLGEISVESEVQKGTTFRVRLPAVR